MHGTVTPDARPGAGVPTVRIAVFIALAHGINDAYASFVPPLLPRIMDGMGISIALAATLGASFSIATALPQPFFGYIADRFGRRALAVGGMLVSAVFVSLMGFASSYWGLLLLLVLGGLGGAAFHPPGASYAVRLIAGKGSGGRYSIFSFGGAIGYSAGPLVAVGLVAWGGMEGLWVAMIPAILFAPVFFLGLPRGEGEPGVVLPAPPPTTVIRELAGPLGIIFGVSAAMAFVQRAFLTMEPIIVAEMGGSETLGAAALSVYLGAQAFGTLTGGFLADRIDRRLLLFMLCALSLPAHLLRCLARALERLRFRGDRHGRLPGDGDASSDRRHGPGDAAAGTGRQLRHRDGPRLDGRSSRGDGNRRCGRCDRAAGRHPAVDARCRYRGPAGAPPPVEVNADGRSALIRRAPLPCSGQ